MLPLRYLGYAKDLMQKGSPSLVLKESLRDAQGKKFPIFPNEAHIKEAVAWLLRAQQATTDGGVSAMYSLYQGWHPSYPETTGYIIPTLLNYASWKGEGSRLMPSIQKMAQFELSKQFPSGAFPGGRIGNKEQPIVFNTGQILFGIVAMFEATGEKNYLQSLTKASDWLAKIQEDDGSWKKFEYLNTKHVYNSRVAWPLLLASKHTKNKEHRDAAIDFLNWAIEQQTSSGWYKNNAFYVGQEPLLHTIAYAIQGILESGIILKNKAYIQSAALASDALLQKLRQNGSFAGSFDENWKSSVNWSCLTGNAQMSIVYSRLFMHTKKKEYRDAAVHINEFLKSTQDLSSRHPGIRGGIKGAYPCYGWYAPLCYINWGAKFFIDALILEEMANTKNTKPLSYALS